MQRGRGGEDGGSAAKRTATAALRTSGSRRTPPVVPPLLPGKAGSSQPQPRQAPTALDLVRVTRHPYPPDRVTERATERVTLAGDRLAQKRRAEHLRCSFTNRVQPTPIPPPYSPGGSPYNFRSLCSLVSLSLPIDASRRSFSQNAKAYAR